MKMYKLLALVLTAVLLLSLAACGRQATPTTTTVAPTTGSAGTTNPSETTVPPTTEEPHVELTREVIFQILDDATALLNENDTITLQANKYTIRYISSNSLQETNYLSISDNVITIQNAKDSDVFSELRYVILMTNLMEEFPDSYAEDNIIEDYLMYNIYQVTFYSEYAAAGYNSAKEFVDDHYKGQLSHTSRFSFIYDGSYEVHETHYCYEDGMHQHIGSYPYCWITKASEYEKYLQSKSEG